MVGQMTPMHLWLRQHLLQGRDPRSQLAHLFGRSADFVRRHPVSITAIEREEAARRRTMELERLWQQRMYEFARRGER